VIQLFFFENLIMKKIKKLKEKKEKVIGSL